ITVTNKSSGITIGYFPRKLDIPENTPIETTITTITASSEAQNVARTFKLIDGANGTFKLGDVSIPPFVNIQSSMWTVPLVLARPLDFETREEFVFKVKAIDAYQREQFEELMIRVTDVNEGPSDILYSGGKDISVHEKLYTNDEVIGRFRVVDDDIEDKHVLRISNNNAIKLNREGELYVPAGTSFDFERRSKIKILVRVADKETAVFRKAFQVKVIDSNEAPTELILVNGTLFDNSPAETSISTVKVRDPDNANWGNQTFAIELVDDGHGLVKLDELILKVAKYNDVCTPTDDYCRIDYESHKALLITFKVTDSSSPPMTAYFNRMIAIEDINDPPRRIHLDGTIL
ncbi:unnamed protein product, partial [Owenia fusiformis]